MQPTRYSSHGKTLIDNIYSNWANFEDVTSGNLTVSLSDQLPQFIIIDNVNVKSKALEHKYIRDVKKLNANDFILDFLTIDFNEILNKPDINNSFNTCLDKMDILINEHLPLKKLTKKELKTYSKP